jgi:hypothetical protein
MTPTARARGSSDASDALADASGMGTSEVTAVSAEAAPGKEGARERTVERRDSAESWVGGWVGEGGWKRDGCVLSDVDERTDGLVSL